MKEREAPAANVGGSSSAKDRTQILPSELRVFCRVLCPFYLQSACNYDFSRLPSPAHVCLMPNHRQRSKGDPAVRRARGFPRLEEYGLNPSLSACVSASAAEGKSCQRSSAGPLSSCVSASPRRTKPQVGHKRLFVLQLWVKRKEKGARSSAASCNSKKETQILLSLS